MICNRRRWLGRAHELGLIDGPLPFTIANNRDAKGKQDKKFDHHCGGCSPPTDSAVVSLLAVEYCHRGLRSLRRSAAIAKLPLVPNLVPKSRRPAPPFRGD